MTQVTTPAAALGLAALLLGCTAEPEVTQGAPSVPDYLGVETRLLEDDLVNFRVGIGGQVMREDAIAYAECAAAQYALIRGYGFARHVRTNVSEEGSILRGDAVYTVSSALPDGLRTIDAEVTVANCKEEGIPTV